MQEHGSKPKSHWYNRIVEAIIHIVQHHLKHIVLLPKSNTNL
jgi:hypothetical protein